MRVVRNVGYIKRRKRQAKWSALFGLALLMSTFWLATAVGPGGVLLAYIPLLGGTILFHIGMREVAKWNRRTPRNDQLLDVRLRNLNEKYALIHYAELGKRAVEHLLVHPGGVLALTARDLPGGVHYRNGRWRKTGSGIGRLFGLGGPQLGNPSFETQANVDALRAYLAEAQFEVDVDGAIVFLHPNVELDVEEPDFPVMNAEGLPEFLRTLPVDAPMTPSEREALVDLLATGEEVERDRPVSTRRPVKRRAA